MPLDTAFAPYRLTPGALPEEAARAAAELLAEPLVVAASEPIPAPLLNRALAAVAAGSAPSAAEACRAAAGSTAGGAGPPRACLSSDRHRTRVAEEIRAALGAGFAGVCLDRPDAPLALGLLGAGFCPECQREVARHLVREYGDHFQPLDLFALARAAVAQASGALSFAQLPLGRDLWRLRNDALLRAVCEHARAARDAARAAARPFEVVAQFEALGPTQLRAVRHVDAAIFPAPLGDADALGVARLVRAALGKRPGALAVSGAPAGSLARLAALAASCGMELSGAEPAGDAGAELAAVRRISRRLHAHGLSPTAGEPVADCAILYSAEADLWTGGRHRDAVVRASDLLARAHVQAPVVLRISDAPASAALVLADAGALSPEEAKEVRRRLDAGGSVLAFGEPAAVDEGGRPGEPFLPSARSGGTHVGAGTLAVLPPLAPERAPRPVPDPATLEKALLAVLGKGRRAASVASRAPVTAVLHRTDGTLLAHLVAPAGVRIEGATLFLAVHVAGGVRRGRFVGADGTDLKLPLSPSGVALSAKLPAFRGYAVLSLAA